MVAREDAELLEASAPSLWERATDRQALGSDEVRAFAVSSLPLDLDRLSLLKSTGGAPALPPPPEGSCDNGVDSNPRGGAFAIVRRWEQRGEPGGQPGLIGGRFSPFSLWYQVQAFG